MSTDSQDAADHLRKRVCKACDRCRLKKSKCDGSSPCSRCKVDNAICVFGERKKSQDKPYPKGYVEQLEQQQQHLVNGLQECYRLLLKAGAWPGAPLKDHDGQVLTHDLLVALGTLKTTADVDEMFEDDPDRLQERLYSHGAQRVHRRGSVASDARSYSHKRAPSAADITPAASPKRSMFRNSFAFDSAPASLSSTQSPHSSRPTSRSLLKPSPVHKEPPRPRRQPDDVLEADASLFQTPWPWTHFASENVPDQPQFSLPQQSPTLMQNLGMQNNHFDDYDAFGMGVNLRYDAGMMNNFTLQQPPVWSNSTGLTPNGLKMSDVVDPEFERYLQMSTDTRSLGRIGT